MSKTQEHFIEELVKKVRVKTEPEIDARVVGAEPRIQDTEVWLITKAEGPLSIGSWILIACIGSRES